MRQTSTPPPISSSGFQSTHPVWGATRGPVFRRQDQRRFQSTHPVWGATGGLYVVSCRLSRFQSTHPVWGATSDTWEYRAHLTPISIHAPRVGCDPQSPYAAPDARFQSTHPVWGATGYLSILDGQRGFQSTHPVWGATSIAIGVGRVVAQISIHAPRVGCDYGLGGPPPLLRGFQSTHPVWGATCLAPDRACSGWHFNPRTPCGVRPFIANEVLSLVEFQSTHPVWGATACVGHKLTGGMISIHAPRVGCDWYACNQNWGGDYFNPRTPCGVRHKALSGTNKEIKFQSTHPVWGATPMTTTGATPAWDFNPRTPCGVRLESLGAGRGVRYISIHAPRVGCDNQHVHQAQMEQHFNPRTPCGVRLHGLRHRLTRKIFQSTHPVWGATTPDTLISRPVSFQSTHPVWGATPGSPFFPGLPLFQSTHPVWGATCPPRPNSE